MPEKRPLEKSIMEVEESSKTLSSLELDDVLDMNFSNPLPKVSKKNPSSSSRVSELASMFALIFERLDNVEFKVGRVDAELSLLKEFNSNESNFGSY